MDMWRTSGDDARLDPARPSGSRRDAHIIGFLRDRGIELERLGEIVQRRVGPARHTLLTSSPVHGLANATSDIDLIRVQSEPLPGPKMATQIFEDGQHLEVISFGDDEVAQALAELRVLAGASPVDIVAALGGWDREHTVRTKYLERIVNGVAQDWSTPYDAWHPDLGVVWMWGSLHKGLRQVLFLRWAEAAGESRGRLGYAVNAVLYLMDAVLSHHGDVYSNKKWYLLRWRRFTASRTEPPGDVIRHLERACDAVASAARSPRTAGPLTPLLIEVTRTVLAAVRAPAGLSLRVSLPDAQRLAFLPGAELLVRGEVALPVSAGAEFDFGCGLDDDPTMPAQRAGELLGVARAGALRIELGGAA